MTHIVVHNYLPKRRTKDARPLARQAVELTYEEDGKQYKRNFSTAEEQEAWVRSKGNTVKVISREKIVKDRHTRGDARAGVHPFRKGADVEVKNTGKIGSVIESDEDRTLVDWRNGKTSRIDTDRLVYFTSSRGKDRHTRGDQGAATIVRPDSKIGKYGDAVSGVTGLPKKANGR
jgi:hypothetical protein